MKRLQIVTALALAFISPAGAAIDPEFEALCQQLILGDNGFFSRSSSDRLEAEIESTPSGPRRAALQGRLAFELLRQGQADRATEVLADALAAVEGNPAHRELEQNLNYDLGLAHMQLAEEANCVDNHSAASCILPIRPSGVHRQPDSSAEAASYLQRALALEPGDPSARWLLNLTQTLAGNYPEGVPESLRWSLPPPSAVSKPPWTDVAPSLGVAVSDLAGGALVDDFDGDGLLDIIASSWDPCAPFKAFRNLGPQGFEDVSDSWGLSRQTGSLTLRHADFDGDGRLDLLALRGAWLGDQGRIRNSLLHNQVAEGRGFVDVTAAAGLAYPAYPTQAAAWADYDLDGDLDLYVGNEGTASSVDPLTLAGLESDHFPSQLFRNNGNGTFTDVARAAGVTNLRHAKGLAWGDHDLDGDPDLYVSNIGDNRFYRNNGDGTFTDIAEELGVVGAPASTFASWFFDYDNDGDLDLFVASYSAPVAAVADGYLSGTPHPGHPLLFLNAGDGTFTEISDEAGLAQPLLVMGADFGDFDGDGWLDAYLGTGAPGFDAVQPNALYRNIGGRSFDDVTYTQGLGHLQKGHAVAFADIDNDGQQEIYEQLGGAFPYDEFRNALFDNPERDASWLTLRFEAEGDNPFAIGARVEVRVVGTAGERSIYRTVGFGSSFGGSSLQEEIGLGQATEVLWVEVLWPGGRNVQRFAPVALDSGYRVVEGAAELRPLSLTPFALGVASSHSPHQH